MKNEKFYKKVGQFSAAVNLLVFAGFKREGEFLKLNDLVYDRIFEMQKMINYEFTTQSTSPF